MINIIIGITLGIICYVGFFEPLAYSTCLVDPENCTKVFVKTKGSTALIRETQSGKVVWFNGRDIFLFNETVGLFCEEPSEPTFVWNLSTNTPRGYLCTRSLTEVESLYSNEPEQIFAIRAKGTISIIEMVNFLLQNNVLHFPKKIMK
jgi:hypothetical protein